MNEWQHVLKECVDGEVFFDDGHRSLYATDASNYRQLPLAVVLPRSAEDVLATLDICRRFQLPVLSRGGGTSLAGQCCNEAVIVDFARYMHRIWDFRPEEKTVWVEPGVVLDQLAQETKKYNLNFGPDLGATARIPGEPDTWEGWEDSAVPPERLDDYLRQLKRLYDNYGYKGGFQRSGFRLLRHGRFFWIRTQQL